MSSAFALTTDITIFAVVSHLVPESWGSLAHHGNRDYDWSLEQSGFDALNVMHFQSADDNFGGALSLTEGASYILIGRISGTTREFLSVDVQGATQSVSATGNTIATPSAALYLGLSDIDEAYQGHLGEFLYFSRALDNTERDAVTTYLLDHWF